MGLSRSIELSPGKTPNFTVATEGAVVAAGADSVPPLPLPVLLVGSFGAGKQEIYSLQFAIFPHNLSSSTSIQLTNGG